MTKPLAPFAMFAAVLAVAGLPIYIHAPKFFVDNYGVGLASLGAVLFGLRLLDVVQDPALGWLSRRLGSHRPIAVAVAATLMALSMIGLFAITPPIAPLAWFTLTLAGLFSAYSFLTISFYAQGVSKARTIGENGHVRLAGWRETGALIGVCLASIAPVALTTITDRPFALFSALFAVAALAAVIAMRSEWQAPPPDQNTGLRPYLENPMTRRLLIIALVNAMPVAVTSTLFLFFVEYRLSSPGWEGPLLLLLFLAAALSAPFWSRAAVTFGAKPTLLVGMGLAIVAFAGTVFLEAGDLVPFALICLASGMALGADLTLLPALFAEASAEVAPDAAEGFGLWSFASKFSLAIAAVLFLPLLEKAGFNPGTGEITASATTTLTFFYATIPLGLKLIALALLAATPLAPKSRNVLQGAHT
ncbi:MFS transporter [Rhodobacteraceae bacterium]|nr:MFS transporter [Paracoccaceae bacterium]